MLVTTIKSVIIFCTLVPILASIPDANDDELPTNYEYYTSGGIESGLSADQPYFTLNGRNITIYSGSMHYFRVPRKYWRDRLRKMRAAGLNAVTTYIAWNLHEHQKGEYDFGAGGSEMEDFLNFTAYLKIAQEEDLFAIIRPGPYICAEFEYGGFPSWLLRDMKNSTMTVRTNDPLYMGHVTSWFNVLLPKLAELEFFKGGPIIAMQVENEYGAFAVDLEHLRSLRQLMLDNGLRNTLFMTSDNPDKGIAGTIPELFLMTGNFQLDPQNQLDTLKQYQPDKPTMVMEYWAGWFDYWGIRRNDWYSIYLVKQVYEVLLQYPASVNIYMFHGGTNWRFLSGANGNDDNSAYMPVATSYDYDAPISEDGDYTEKYYAIKELIAKYNPIKTKLPDVPESTKRVAYPSVSITASLPFNEVLETITSVQSENVVSMELLDTNNGNGQSFGYIVYRKENLNLQANARLTIQGHVCDTVTVLVNGKLVSPKIQSYADLDGFGGWRENNSGIVLGAVALQNVTLDLVVENWGRVHAGAWGQYKGLWQSSVLVDGEEIHDWHIYSLDFKKNWLNSLADWKDVSDTTGPKLYKTELEVEGEPSDTFVDMSRWTKGIVIVNGFVLGRYAKMGPAETLYLPAPLLKEGTNNVVVFEHYEAATDVMFSADPIYIVPSNDTNVLN